MGATNSPLTSRLFIQEGVGQPLYYVGCVGVRGVQIDPRQQEFVRSVDESGIVVEAIPRHPNPAPFDVTFGKNYRKWQSVFRNSNKGCLPNFFLASALCEDDTRIADPTYFTDGIWLYSVSPNSGYQVGNNTIITSDPNTAVKREDQISMTSTLGAFAGETNYGTLGSLAATKPPIQSLASIDDGKCADYICRACDLEGCQKLLVNVGSEYMYSVDGGDNWISIATSGAGIAQAFNGNAFMVNATSILLTSDVTVALASWTTATTDVAFAGLCNIVQIDARTLVVGGSTGQVWRSVNGGGNWTQIRASTVGTPDFVAMDYNKVTGTIVAIQKLTTDIHFAVSYDRGKNWTTLATSPVPAETYGANTNPVVKSAGPLNFLLVNGNLYRLSCTLGVTTYSAVTLVGATGDITGVGVVDEDNPNGVWLTVGGTGGMKIFRSNDGLNTAVAETLTFTITAAGGTGLVNNPVTNCHGKYGESLLFAFGRNIYYGRDWESFFAE